MPYAERSLPRTNRSMGSGRVTLLHGLEAFGGGIGFVIATPSVWGSHHLSNWLIGPDPGVWGQIGYWGMMIPLAVVSFLAAALLALSLAQPLSGFALEAIVHAQEIALTGTAPPKASFLTALISTTVAVAISLLVGGTLLVILFLVSFFFPPAAVVTVPLKVLVCGWILAWDFIDYPLAMRGVGLEGRFAWVGRNFGAFTLFGVLWALLVVLPGVVLLVLPMGVAGATRLVVADELGAFLPSRARSAAE